MGNGWITPHAGKVLGKLQNGLPLLFTDPHAIPFPQPLTFLLGVGQLDRLACINIIIFTNIHLAKLRLPVVEGRLADPVLAAQIGCLHPRLMLLQNPDNLLFRVPALSYLVLPFTLRENSNFHWMRFPGAGQSSY
jgi:hypothetical protein